VGRWVVELVKWWLYQKMVKYNIGVVNIFGGALVGIG
jgi:hypothetical protein